MAEATGLPWKLARPKMKIKAGLWLEKNVVKCPYVRALLSVQGIVVLGLLIYTLIAGICQKWKPTFDVSVEKALWFQYVTDKLADNGERVINQEWIDERGIYSYIFLELLVENGKEYVSTIAEIGIDKLCLEDYERLHLWIKREPTFNFQWADSLGYAKSFELLDDKKRFLWDLDWWDGIDLSVFQPKEKRPIYIILEFKTHSILEGEVRGEFHLIDMGMNRIGKQFEAVQGRDGRAKEFVKR